MVVALKVGVAVVMSSNKTTVKFTVSTDPSFHE